MQTRPQPSNEAVDATVKTICLFWARHLKGAFHPDTRAADYCLAPGLATRYDRDMQYLWTNAADPYDSAIAAQLSTYPHLYGRFDYTPPPAD